MSPRHAYVLALAAALAGANAVYPVAADARPLVPSRSVSLTVSVAGETAVSFTTLPNARCLMGDGSKRPMVLYADDNGAVRFNARPGRGAASSIRLIAKCDAVGRSMTLPLEFHAVAGVVHNPKPAIAADPNFRLPRGFNPLTASDQDLERYGLPARPNRVASPEAYALWVHAMSVPTIRVKPTRVLRSDRIHRPPLQLRKHENGGLTASNWSGVADVGKTGQFNRVEGDWTVPSVTAPFAEAPAYSSLWAGLDGAGISKDVLQNGTESDVDVILLWTFTSYYAWYEFYPDGGSTQFSSVSVNPGDEIYSISNQCWDKYGNMMGCYYIEDITQGESEEAYEYPAVPSNFKGNTAEWILERPTVGGSLYPLPDYSFAQTTNMYVWDTKKKAFEGLFHESFNTYAMMNGPDLLSSVAAFPIPKDPFAQFFWFNYQ